MTAGAAARARSVAANESVRVRKIADAAATAVLWVMASSIIVMLAAFIVYVVYLGWTALSPQFIFGVPTETTAGGGIGPEIYNSFYILVLTLLFTTPIAVAGGVFLQGGAVVATVFDDGVIDVLIGSGAADGYFANTTAGALDLLFGLAPGEQVVDIH